MAILFCSRLLRRGAVERQARRGTAASSCPGAAQRVCRSHRRKLSAACPFCTSVIPLLFYTPGVPQSHLTIEVTEGERRCPPTLPEVGKMLIQAGEGGPLGLGGEGEPPLVRKLEVRKFRASVLSLLRRQRGSESLSPALRIASVTAGVQGRG